MTALPLPKYALQHFGAGAMGHAEQVRSTALSPDGTRLVSIGNDRLLKVWSVDDGQCVAHYPLDGIGTEFLAFLSDSQVLVFDDMSGPVKLDLGSGKRDVIELLDEGLGGGPRYKPDTVWDYREMAFAPEAGVLAVRYKLRHDNSRRCAQLRLWDLDAGQCTHTFELSSDDAVSLNVDIEHRLCVEINSFAISDDAKHLLAFCQAIDQQESVGHIKAYFLAMWDVESGQLRYVRSYEPYFTPSMEQLTFIDAGQRFLIDFSGVHIFDTLSGDLLRTTANENPITTHPDLTGPHSAYPEHAVVVPGSDWLVVSTRCGLARVNRRDWSVEQAVAYNKRFFVLGLCASARGDCVVVVDDRALVLWRLSDLAPIHQGDGHNNAIVALDISPDLNQVVSTDLYEVKAWNTNTGQLQWQRPGAVTSTAFSPDSTQIAVASRQPAILKAQSGQVQTPLNAAGQVLSVSWGQTLRRVSLSGECEYAVYEGADAGGQPRTTISCPLARFWPQFSGDGKTLLLWSERNELTLWDTTTGRLRWKHDQDMVSCAALSHDGAMVASSGVDFSGVQVWSAADNRLIQHLSPRGPNAKALAFDPKGELMAMAVGSDVRIFKTATWKKWRTLRDLHGGDVTEMAFSPCGRRLITGDSTGSVGLWKIRR